MLLAAFGYLIARTEWALLHCLDRLRLSTLDLLRWLSAFTPAYHPFISICIRIIAYTPTARQNASQSMFPTLTPGVYAIILHITFHLAYAIQATLRFITK